MKKLLIVVLVLLFTVSLATAKELKIGDKAAPFSLKDAEGNEYTLDTPPYAGKVVVVYYFSEKDERFQAQIEAANLDGKTWEPMSVANLKDMSGLGEKFGDSLPLARLYVPRLTLKGEQKKIKRPILIDDDYILLNAWGLNKRAHNVVVIDRNRVVRYIYRAPVGVTKMPHDEVNKLIAVLRNYQEEPAEGLASSDSVGPKIIVSSPPVKRGVKIETKDNSLTVVGRAEDISGVASVRVNEQEANLDASDNFTADILLKVGENTIAVSATDVYRNRSIEHFQIVRIADEPAKGPQALVPVADYSGLMKGRDYALLIGINDYMYLEKLRTAVNDATTVSRVLSDDYGFEVKLVLDRQATRDKIARELNNLRKKLTSTDRLIIYYAGHGEMDRETDASYWLPVDAAPSETVNWMDTKIITDELKRIPARHILVISDSCYAGTLVREATTDLHVNEERAQFLRKMLEKTSRTLLASGGDEPVADLGGSGHSVFADAFIRALKNPSDKVFTAEELYMTHIKESVAGRADQTPEYSIIRNSRHEGGDFVFMKRR